MQEITRSSGHRGRGLHYPCPSIVALPGGRSKGPKAPSPFPQPIVGNGPPSLESLPPYGQQRAVQPHSAASKAEQRRKTDFYQMELKATLRTFHTPKEVQPKRGILVSQCELQGSTGLAVFGAASPGAWDADDQSVFECRGVPACVQFSDLKDFLGVSDVSVVLSCRVWGGFH